MLRIETAVKAPAAHDQAAKARAGALRRLGHKALPYAMVAPAMVVFGLFTIYPIFYMIYLSFFKWNLIGEKVYIGVKNFTDMFANPDFWQVLGNSLYYMVATVFFSIALALLLAVYLKKDTRINRALQSVVFTPYIVSLVSVAFVWMWLMDSDYGLLNYILELLHLPKVGWLEDPKVAMNSLVLVSVWKSLGYNAIILISAMQAVPGYLYEAAALDRAKPATVFFKVTLPMISPSLFFLTLMNIIASLKVFETVNIMTQGGPMNSTNTLVHELYLYGFSYYKIGYASALGVVLMVVIGLFTIAYFWALGRRVHYR